MYCFGHDDIHNKKIKNNRAIYVVKFSEQIDLFIIAEFLDF